MSTRGSDSALIAGSATTSGAGVLHPERLSRTAELTRHPCATDLQPWVEWYWRLTWDLPDGATYTSHTLPHPTCNLSVERGESSRAIGDDPVVITGVVTRRFDVTIRRTGVVFAAKFRPGGLPALTGVSARVHRDRVLPARMLLADDVLAPLRTIGTETSVDASIGAMDDALTALAGTAGPDSHYETALQIVADLLADRSLTQVAQLTEHYALSARSLQRLFLHYLGVSPKWVIRRYRIHDAVTDLDNGYDGSLADLAASLGWYDQAHFHRDFADLVGQTPGDYRRGGQR